MGIEISFIFELIINNWIRISVSGGDAESYNKVQGKDHFERVIKNIFMISNEKIKKRSNIKIGIRMLVNEENLYTLSKLADKVTRSLFAVNPILGLF